MTMLKKVFTSEIKSIDEKENTLTAYISTDTIDRMKEVLDPKGVDVSQYRKNPVVLWAHDYEKPPIGKALWVKRDGQGILSKVKFATTSFAQEIFQLYKEGFLKAFSVGFIPRETEDGDGEKQPRRTYKKWELLEYSAVPVPANPDALALAIQKGVLKTEALKESIEKGWGQEEVLFEAAAPEPIIEVAAPLPEEKTIQPAVVNPGLEELQAENTLLKEKVVSLEKDNAGLKYKLYESNAKKQASVAPEITADNLASKVVEVVDRVIRQAQGKVD